MRVLKDLWLGNIVPIEAALPKDDECRNTLRELVGEQQTLHEMLSGQGRQILASYNDTQIKLQDFAERAAFTQGFCLGAKIILDILEGERI